jgi:putative endonuclease
MVRSLKLPWTKPVTTKKTGDITERYAGDFLVAQGLIIEEKNFASRLGEIDIIVKDADTYVFVEVKYRASMSFGGAISAISTKKQQKIRKTAAIYLQQCGLNEYNTSCRFDVIALQGNINNLDITWLKNAF